MQTIVITTTSAYWAQAQKAGVYARSTIDTTLDEVGFIHATSPRQTTALLNRRFTNRNDIVLLLVDADAVTPPVKFEPALSGTPGLFPHIYGPLNTDAVYDTVIPQRDASGVYSEPQQLSGLGQGHEPGPAG